MRHLFGQGMEPYDRPNMAQFITRRGYDYANIQLFLYEQHVKYEPSFVF